MMMMTFYTFRYIHHERHREFFFRSNAKQADTVVTDGFDAFESIAELHSSSAVQSSTAAQLDTEMQLVHLPSIVNWSVFAEPQCSSTVEVCFEFSSLRAGHAYAIRCRVNGQLMDPGHWLYLGKGSKRKTVKKRSGWPLGLTPPPLKRASKCEKLLTSCHIWGYFVVL